MSYCSLDEAWNLCQPLKDNDVPESSTVDIGGYQLSGEQLPGSLPSSQMESDFAAFMQKSQLDADKTSTERAKELILQDKGRLCHLVLKHLDDCDECREKMIKRLGGSNDLIEKFENLNSPNYLEIFMIILVGVILIIIMDSFVRLGKMMKS